MFAKRLFKLGWSLLLALLPSAAWALIDLPIDVTAFREAADLASVSGLSRPIDQAMGLMDEQDFCRAYDALVERGYGDALAGRICGFGKKYASHGSVTLSAPLATLEFDQLFGQSRAAYETNGSGRFLRKGPNGFAGFAESLALYDFAAIDYEGRLNANEQDFGYRTQRLYAKGQAWGWSLKAGRDAERLGPGYHGSLLLGADAPPMNLWRVRSEEPMHLPGFLRGAGAFRFTLFNAYLSDNSPRPPDARYGGKGRPLIEDPRLLGMRLAYAPASWLDFGFNRTVFYGGKGKPAYNTPGEWWKLFSAKDENVRGGNRDYDNDQLASMDVVLRPGFFRNAGPIKGGEAYFEYAGNDLVAAWQGDKTRFIEPVRFSAIGLLGGLYITSAESDLRVEFAQTNKTWYRHQSYGQGYSCQGAPLGHHMGGDARDWYFAVGRYVAPAVRMETSLDMEERGRSLKSVEKRVEAATALEARDLDLGGLKLKVRGDLSYTRVTDPINEPGRTRLNEWSAGLTLSTVL